MKVGCFVVGLIVGLNCWADLSVAKVGDSIIDSMALTEVNF